MPKLRINIYALISFVVFWVFFLGFSSAACSTDMITGSATSPWNSQSSWACRSNTSFWNSQRYNNSISPTWNNSLLFLKMFDITRSNCSASNVKVIQTKMQAIWWSCSTCIDGKMWQVTRTKLENNCINSICSSPSTTPTLKNWNLVCGSWYELQNNGLWSWNCCVEKTICGQKYSWWQQIGASITDIQFDQTKCCKKIVDGLPNELNTLPFCDNLSCSDPKKPLSGWVCDPWYIPDANGCCVEQCPAPYRWLSWGSCNAWGSWFVGITLSGNSCCEQCNKAPINWQNCEQTYWSGWYDSWKCCAYECPKKWQPAPEWQKLDEKNCRWICDPTKKCCGIQLNTVVPFIWDCIEMTSQNDVWAGSSENTSAVNQLNAFPFLMMGLSKILVTVILIFSFLIVIASWLMMTTWVYDESNYKTWMDRIKKVVVALILLWSSWLILRLINPSFFGG